MPPRPRAVALAAISYGDRLLVSEVRDPATGALFYRPPGGRIRFGERAAETVVRELAEEAGVVVRPLRMLGVLESVFEYGGQPAHEIVLIVEAEPVDPALTARESLPRLDRPDRRLVWRALADFDAPGAPLLAPAGLLDLLRAARG